MPREVADAAVEKQLATQGAPNATVNCQANISVKVVYEPEEGSCPSCISFARAGAVRQQRCLDFTRVAPHATRDCATQLTRCADGPR